MSDCQGYKTLAILLQGDINLGHLHAPEPPVGSDPTVGFSHAHAFADLSPLPLLLPS